MARRLIVCGVCLVSGGCTPPAQLAEVPSTLTDVAFVGVNVVPMTSGDSILSDRTVLVRDGRIVAIGPTTTVTIPARALRIDGRGQFLMPGLVDAHVHLEYFDDPGVLALFLANGVTSVRNMDGRPYLLDWRRRVASADLIGPTIYSAGPILDGDPPVRDDNTVIRNASEATTAVSTQASAGYDFVKVYTNLSREAYAAVVDAARERNLPVAGHVPRRMSIRDVLTAAQHSIEHLSDFDELIEADSSSIRGRFHWSKLYLAMAADSAKVIDASRLVAASGVWIVPTLIQADRGVAPPDSARAWLSAPEMIHIPADSRKFWEGINTRASARMDSADWSVVARGRANRRRLVRALHSAGAKLAVGTDTPNPFVVPGFSVHEELRILVDAGLSPQEALTLATRRPAELMRVSATVGTVAVGMRADLLLVSGNPFADIRRVQRPRGVMARGRWFPAAELEALLGRTVLRSPP